MATEDYGSVTRMLGDLKGGADAASRRLWERYFDRLVRLARDQLGAAPRAVADEEDVALSAFDSFFAGAARGRFPRLEDRDDLWRILVTIAARKAADHAARQTRQKRGGGRVFNEGALAGGGSGAAGVDRFPGAQPTPEFAAIMSEEVYRLFEALPDEELRLVALLKMEGYTNEEIAASLDYALRSVERRLEKIRNLWSRGEEFPPADRHEGPSPFEILIREGDRLVYLGQFEGPVELGRQHGAEADPFYRGREAGRWRLVIAARPDDTVSRRQVLFEPGEGGTIRVSNSSGKIPVGLAGPVSDGGGPAAVLSPGEARELRLGASNVLTLGRLMIRVSTAGGSRNG